MPRPKGPSPKSVKRIYAVLVGEPKCFEDIVKETGLHRNTVGATLNFLVKRGMLRRYRKGHKVMYEMEKYQNYFKVPLTVVGWEIPWIELMMTKEDWKEKWKRVDAEIRSGPSTKSLSAKRKFNEMLYKTLVEPNQELAQVLEEIGMDVPLKYFLEHLQTPFCLECLKKEKVFVKGQFVEETGELCCPKCGLVLERITFENRLPKSR